MPADDSKRSNSDHYQQLLFRYCNHPHSESRDQQVFFIDINVRNGQFYRFISSNPIGFYCFKLELLNNHA
ncbi:hypothetical protein FGO68_gene13880 [Halteria grandinella]|uniref:Uncharacterized protein n=1 Tax=Halteria grandinella TaxID=5974 RepID=A0A8J8NWD8_HALGN|nr:hypothetical protein FGO68_gene13880 [Halteria grandinella]